VKVLGTNGQALGAIIEIWAGGCGWKVDKGILLALVSETRAPPVDEKCDEYS
jgi:hypothetical protein